MLFHRTTAAAALVFALLACSDSPADTAFCSAIADCDPGQYCSADGVCKSDCEDDNSCPPDEFCNENGQCEEPDTDSDTGSDTDNPNTDPCGDAVLLVVDRSSSMDSSGKWDPLKTILAEVLGSYATGTEYGLEVFPDDSCDDSYAGTDIGILCRAPDNMAVDIGGSVASINGSLENVGTCGGTPITSALLKAQEEVDDYDAEVRIVLITDGVPNCNTEIAIDDCECLLDPESLCDTSPENCLDNAEANQVASELDTAGAPVHILTYQVDPEWVWVLHALAGAGGTGAAVEGETAEEVGAALGEILDAIINC